MERPTRRATIAAGTAALALASRGRAARPARRRPSIVMIVADDLGYSDLGCFGGEIRTPHLDALALSGTRLTNLHVAAGCAPTRAMLLAGVDHHRAGLGAFPELIDAAQRGKPGYEGGLVPEAVCVADPLRAAGYRTMIAGKWHLGVQPWADPSVRGFDRSFVLVGGGGSHFGVRGDGRPGPDMEYRADGQKLAALPAGFYSSDAYTTRLIDFLGEPMARDRPFFAYLPFTAPHYPLQVPPEDIALYRGRYDDGWGRLLARRLEGMRRAGVMPAGTIVSDAAELDARWQAATPEERTISARGMEVYAAMVDRLDRNVGRLVAYLKARGRFDDTIFLFLSDNGPEGTELDKSERHAAIGKAMLAGADNRLDSIGGPRSYVWYGPGWAHATAPAFRLFKHYPTEGGIRVPAFAVGPGIAKGRVTDAYGFATDVAPTLLAWAGVPLPAAAERFRYRGASLAGIFGGAAHAVHPPGQANGWELWGRLGYREGRWKAVMIPPPSGPGRWQLYDLDSDPGERLDLAEARPAQLKSMIAGWQAYAFDNGVVLPAVPGL